MLQIVLSLGACRQPTFIPLDPEDSAKPAFDPQKLPPAPGEPGSEPGSQPTVPPCTPAARIVLNEVCPANVQSLSDVEGESVDWLELYNADAVPIDLGGWTLTDDPDEPGKWSFPALTLEPGAFLLVQASEKDRVRIVGSWETRIDEGHQWRYLPVLAPPDPDWYLPGYDDSAWQIGPSGFGKGDSDDQTRVSANTIYIRTTFDLTQDELADLVSLVLHVDYDDGFAAYLNGVDVARVALGLPGVPPPWDALTAYTHEARLKEGLRPEYFDLDASIPLLQEGSNTLALEVHNLTTDSSDLTLIPFLTLGFGSDRGGQAAAVLGLPEIDLHTNFGLRASGEAVRLFDPAGCQADLLDPISLWADESYGRQPDGTGALGYFMEPTPGAPNTTESRPGFAAPPVLAPAPGYYAGGTQVTVTADPAARVHVAWGGKEPTEDDPLYQGALPTGDVGEAVVLRARAWQDGLWPSRIATSTYLLEPPGTLPIVSLVTDPDNLWDEETGIYARGPNADPEYPYNGANFYQHWKRPVHVEEWEPDGTLGFSLDGSVEIHGGNSRRNEQKNLEIKIKGGWSDNDAIEHELFPGLGLTTFPRLLLRAGSADWLGCHADGCEQGAMLRDTLIQELTVGADLDRMASRPARVYLNGEYWGLYFINEKPDGTYVQTRHGETDIDLIKSVGFPMEGDPIRWLELLEWLRTHDLADPANYAQAQDLIEIEELQNYFLFQVFVANTDWPMNNIKFWRPRAEGGRWRWMLYGTEFGLGLKRDADHDTLAMALAPDGVDWPNPAWSTELFRLLFQSPEFTETFLNRYADTLNTLLLPERTHGLLHDLADQIAPEIPRHVARWGSWTDGVTVHALDGTEWEPEIAYIEQWLAERPEHARNHALAQFGLPGTWTLTLEADPPGSGTFALTAVTVEPPFSGTYFQGVPVTVTAIPAPGYTFQGWSDPSLGPDPSVQIEATSTMTLVARFQ